MKRNIFLLTTALLLTGTLTACNSNSKPDCWKAKHNTINKDCNSGNGGFSMKTPAGKGKSDKKDASPSVDASKTNEGDTNQNVPAEDNSPTNDTDSEPNVPDQDSNASPSTQSNSNDVRGFDPFTAGLYGPGT